MTTVYPLTRCLLRECVYRHAVQRSRYMNSLSSNSLQQIANEFVPTELQYGERLQMDSGSMYVVGDGQFDRVLYSRDGGHVDRVQSLHRGNSTGVTSVVSNETLCVLWMSVHLLWLS